MHAALDAQKAAHLADPYPTAAVRKDRLKRLLAALEDNAPRIGEAMMADFGYRSPDQSFFVEVVTTAKPLKEAIKRVEKWMKPEKRHLDPLFRLAGAKAHVHYQPLGVVGCISPWNFPINLTFSPLAGIFAAGNRAMVKPSEMTPASADLIADIAKTHFDATELAVFTGGPDVAAEFSSLPFDHLLYTGGENVARKIMHAAADNLTPVTLELGGKCPVVVGRNADLYAAASRVAFGKILNGGQICLAPDHVFVPRDKLEAFEETIVKAFREMLPEDQAGKDFVSALGARNADRLRGYIEDAKARGARVVVPVSPESFRPPAGESANIVAPTLLFDTPDDAKVMNAEIFGSVLPVIAYDSFEDVVTELAAMSSPLALYYFGTNKAEIDTLSKRTRSGGFGINDTIIHYTMDDLPFGGVGPSGMGVYHGIAGFKEFSHARSVYRHPPIDAGKPLRPPYTDAFKRVTRFLLKHG